MIRHTPTPLADCSIEILPGAKLPYPKLYSMTDRELKALWTFIDKKLKHGFIQPTRQKVAAQYCLEKKRMVPLVDSLTITVLMLSV